MEILKQYGRSFGAIFLGFIAASIVIMSVQLTCHKIFPPDEKLLAQAKKENNATDAEAAAAMAKIVASTPVAGKALVVLAYILGSIAGGWVAARMARHQHMGHALVVGGCLMMGAISNFIKIPHPVWMIASSMAAYLPCAWVGARLRMRTLEPEIAAEDPEG